MRLAPSCLRRSPSRTDRPACEPPPASNIPNEEYAVGVVPDQAGGRRLEDQQIVAKLLAQRALVSRHPHGLDPTRGVPTRARSRESRLGQCSGMTPELRSG